MSFRHLVPVVLVLAAAYPSSNAAPQTNSSPHSTPQGGAPAPKKQAESPQNTTHPDEGQRVFDQNCSRCHTAPDGFSTRISGTVVRHMRVRASLSKRDEQALLRFLNP